MARRKKPSGDKRERHSLERRPGTRLPRKSILIVCEGAETEPKYFNALRKAHKLGTVSVKVVGGKGKTAAVQVVERSIKLREARKKQASASLKYAAYEEVWCVLDRESKHENKSFERAKIVAEQNNISLAVSNPAFEYWYLLHFEYTTRSFQNAKAVEKELEKYIPEYDKSDNVFIQFESNTPTAIERAKRVLKNRLDKQDLYPNPSTYVHKIVEQLLD